MTNPQTPQNAAQGADWLRTALQEVRGAGALDDNNGGGDWSHSDAVIERKLAAIEAKIAEREVAALTKLRADITRYVKMPDMMPEQFAGTIKAAKLNYLQMRRVVDKHIEAAQKAKEV